MITNTKYVPVVTLSTQDNAKLLEPLKSGFKRPLDWNKYRSMMTKQAQNQYLDFLIWLSFKGLNMYFLFTFENEMIQEVTSNFMDQPYK